MHLPRVGTTQEHDLRPWGPGYRATRAACPPQNHSKAGLRQPGLPKRVCGASGLCARRDEPLSCPDRKGLSLPRAGGMCVGRITTGPRAAPVPLARGDPSETDRHDCIADSASRVPRDCTDYTDSRLPSSSRMAARGPCSVSCDRPRSDPGTEPKTDSAPHGGCCTDQ